MKLIFISHSEVLICRREDASRLLFMMLLILNTNSDVKGIHDLTSANHNLQKEQSANTPDVFISSSMSACQYQNTQRQVSECHFSFRTMFLLSIPAFFSPFLSICNLFLVSFSRVGVIAPTTLSLFLNIQTYLCCHTLFLLHL